MTAIIKLFRSTVFKVSFAYLLITAIGAGLVLGRIGWHIKELIEDQIGQTVDADITGLAEQYAQGGITRLVEIIEQRTRQPGADLYLVTTHAGQPIAGNIARLPEGIPSYSSLVKTQYQRPNEAKKHHAIARIFALPGGFRLLVGHDLEEGESLRRIVGGALVTSLIWLIVIGTLGGLWIARRVLNRIDAINAQAKTIVAGDLSRRLPLAGTGDELDRLVMNLNTMLDRICALMGGLKEVSDNIAHDLKTPLTRLRNGTEEALRLAKSPEEYRGALEKVIEESDRLIQIFDALLMIAGAEAGSGREGMTEFDATNVVRDVGELYEPAAEDQGVKLTLHVEPDLWLRGSRELLGQVLSNLIDNALKYGAETVPDGAGPSIDLKAIHIGNKIEISVADHGPGIAVKDRDHVLDRFVRLENSRSRPGSGLGLSLAAAVMRLHNGELRLEDNHPGLRVVLTFQAVQGKPHSAPPLIEATALS
ncbi:sensor histidine kinase [Beijerinckia indica]|uniref:histidine kinase n=1 Tax=Beijerinckia indica subsp. indica (strain ATCC 9039 / DSM 1715 / NCIMB 8712) TaxID=395963 RepID=B2IGU4_BEII9|nr:ATP-binding protein [Beijerinckia indica]ACB95855.1 integral membrane sensor signal transduction histidine kinase [Beijerinckia indica subsp. indica ATCC 9039]